MQSVYKLPIALTVLHQVEEGRLNISQPVRFLSSDLISPGQHSPLRDAHPHGGVDVPLLELLRLAVEQSDGVASDILLRVIGGPKVADDYIRSLGIDGIHIADTEKIAGPRPHRAISQRRGTASPGCTAAAHCGPLAAFARKHPATPGLDDEYPHRRSPHSRLIAAGHHCRAQDRDLGRGSRRDARDQ